MTNMTNGSTQALRRFAMSWLAFGFVALATACGGGSDDDPAPSSSTTPNFAGSYTVTFTKTQDSCATTAAPTISGTDVATQAGRNMTLNSGSFVFTGTVDADNGGFTVSNTTVSGTVTSTGTATFRLRPATGDFNEGLTLAAA